ncbi:uncharacterized protein LOC102297446, partial [Haplochromis burtoni]|uniref:uncharacterized protein LOC102297446 n=1 Tax=Haplochromis burtoni TaxID=8153 RepID=UPI001C2DE155
LTCHCYKHTVVQPILKKSSLDQNDLANFRPISKLPFLSKILEKIVHSQLQTYLDANNIGENFQSGFKPRHSTETALLRVFNDLLSIADSGRLVVFILLDLSSAFDLVDHNVLLMRLEHLVGITGSALSWFKSYLSERSFSVTMDTCSSSIAPVTSGVPLGSVLGPMLFSLYLLPLGRIFDKYNISFHFYADDIQIYFELAEDVTSSLQHFSDCMNEVKIWLLSNSLILNDKKTEIVVFDTPSSRAELTGIFGPFADSLSDTVRTLGVVLDSSFKLDKHVSSVVKSSSINYVDLEKCIHAFVTSRLDYCNSLYTGLHSALVHKLQLVQTAAARLLTGTGRFESITPALSDLHWLPIKLRIDFKILLLTFKIINSTVPSYLTDLLSCYIPGRALRSGQMLLVRPRSRLKTRGDRAFAAVAPYL